MIESGLFPGALKRSFPRINAGAPTTLPTTKVRAAWRERYLTNDDLVCYTSNQCQTRSDMRFITIALGSASLFLIAAAVAQTAPPPGTAAQRKANQQARIAQGVKSGQLTAHETGNLETREASVNKEERNMRAANNGKLTAADRTAINNRQNKISNSIYQDKHNAAVQK
jgi:hypothetical protein